MSLLFYPQKSYCPPSLRHYWQYLIAKVQINNEKVRFYIKNFYSFFHRPVRYLLTVRELALRHEDEANAMC